MLKLIETLRAKPSDRNIRIIRVVFAIILLGVIYFGFSKTTWEFSNIPKEILYVLYLFPFIGLVRGIFDPGIMRRKLWKWTQVTLWGLMLILSWFFIETDTGGSAAPIVSSVSGEISAVDLANQATVSVAKIVDTDFWIWFFGFWLLLAGLTIASKNITLKNERYGEKVTKIRV
jgi:hypothetical protein